MKILGIETSCDETSAAIVEDVENPKKRILAHKIASQIKDHQPYGGVIPEIASRNHLKLLPSIIQDVLKEVGLSLNNIDAISATGGPGLIGGLLVGVMMAKSIAMALNKPFIAVNHLEGHALTVRLTHNVAFPYLLLLISGGHCQFLEVFGVGKYKLLGETLDDAAGEIFDKVGRILGLDYPGGPFIEKAALKGDLTRFYLPVPLKKRKGCDMSFSGLKTAARLLIEQEQPLSDEQ
ncbi:MAG: tRNA (adenosine(37)-N6)-threonylcarbamoyltransferase complex transferase subunit TsaD, partial [Alphaproteobacteria bacterium]